MRVKRSMGVKRGPERLRGSTDTSVIGSGDFMNVLHVVRPPNEPMTRTDETHLCHDIRRPLLGVQ